MTRIVLLVLVGSLSVVGCGGSSGNDTGGDARSSTAAPSTVPSAEPARSPDAPPPFSDEELRDLVAPVALYPDVVLASLFPATTYPDQVRDAAAWLRTQDGSVDEVPVDRGWDGSVAALLQFPDVLYWLDENDTWADQVATAVTYQQGATLDAVQAFRRDAKDAGNLESNEYQEVEVQDTPPAPPGGTAPEPTINIQPAQPDVVYVPQYNPVQVVQPVTTATTVSPWVSFGTGMLVGGLGAWAMYSIFDDDDWDDHWHGKYNGGHNRKITVNGDVNINTGRPGGGYYRPPGWNHGPNRPGAWHPDYRPGRPGNRPGSGGVARPTPYAGTKPRPGHSGVRPPSKPGTNRPPSPVATARPAPRPPGGWTGTQRPTGGKGATKPAAIAKPSAPPALAREAGARSDAARGHASLQGAKAPKAAPRPVTPKRSPQPKPAAQPRVQQPQVRPGQGGGHGQQHAPALGRTPAPATRQYSQRGHASMGGTGGRRGGGGGGGGRRGGGGGRRGR